MEIGSKLKSLFDLKQENKKRMFIVLVFFLLSFSVVRFYSMNFTKYVFVKGYHIHHFYFGTAALFLGGILAVLGNSRKRMWVASALLGTGAGLFLDELGLLLTCTTSDKTCAYLFPDTADIVMTATTIIIFLIAMVGDNIEASKEKYFKR